MTARNSLSRRAKLVEQVGMLVRSLSCPGTTLLERQNSAQRNLPMGGVGQLLAFQLASLDQTADVLTRKAKLVRRLGRR